MNIKKKYNIFNNDLFHKFAEDIGEFSEEEYAERMEEESDDDGEFDGYIVPDGYFSENEEGYDEEGNSNY